MKEVMMVLIPVLCPHCQSDQVIKGGKTEAGKQRYKCQNVDCPHYSFQLDLTYKGRSPEQYCGQNLGCLFGNDAIVAKGFVVWT